MKDGIQPAIERAKQAGIIVIAVDTPAKSADAVVMTNAVQAGEKSCQYLFEQMGGKGNVLMVDGTPLQTIRDRITGCKNVVKKFPDIKVVGQQASKNDRASGLAVTTDMLTATPDVQGDLRHERPVGPGRGAGGPAGRQGWRALKSPAWMEARRPWPNSSSAGSPFIGTATQNPAEMVRKAVEVAQNIIDNKPPADTTILIPSELVTRDTVSQYTGW